MQSNRFNVFFDAVSNEIDIDKDLIKRLKRQELSFTPLRGLKSLKYIDKYNVSADLYLLFSIFFVVLSPMFFLVKMLFSIPCIMKEKPPVDSNKQNLVLVANGRVEYLFNKVNKSADASFLNVNQPVNKNNSNIHQSLSVKSALHSYFYAVSSIVLFFPKLKDKRDMLQLYVAYEWFLTYDALQKSKEEIETVYFANHYDRWAVMFDSIYSTKNLILLQHGILPDSLKLSYKLKNLKHIFAIDKLSVGIFRKMFHCQNTNFKMLDISLSLNEIHSEKMTLLLIGQPSCIEVEVEMVKELMKSKYDIYIKPHPLYDVTEYQKLEQVTIISERHFYPKVNVALCYESTLGVEYEASGIPVIWWKGMKATEIVSQLNGRKE